MEACLTGSSGGHPINIVFLKRDIPDTDKACVHQAAEIRRRCHLSSSSRPAAAAVVRLKMYSPAILLIGAILLPPSQPLPAEGWETYAFNPKLLIKVSLNISQTPATLEP